MLRFTVHHEPTPQWAKGAFEQALTEHGLAAVMIVLLLALALLNRLWR